MTSQWKLPIGSNNTPKSLTESVGKSSLSRNEGIKVQRFTNHHIDCWKPWLSGFKAPIMGGGGGGVGGQGIGWGFDCLCCPWGWRFDLSCSPGGGDIWIFLRPTWRYLTADSHEKDWDPTNVSRFHASRMRHTVWKDQKVMEANESKRRLSGFHCFVFKFRLF